MCVLAWGAGAGLAPAARYDWYGQEMNEYWHGTTNGYRNRRCRFSECRRANADYERAKDARLRLNRRGCLHKRAVRHGVGRLKCIDCAKTFKNA